MAEKSSTQGLVSAARASGLTPLTHLFAALSVSFNLRLAHWSFESPTGLGSPLNCGAHHIVCGGTQFIQSALVQPPSAIPTPFVPAQSIRSP